MNEDQINNAKDIRHAISETAADLARAQHLGDKEVRAELMRHLTRLQDIEYAVLSMVKVDAATQEDQE